MRAMAELVRAPAALTVLGDTVAGSAVAGLPLRGRRLALPLASVSLYWAGMALNDWADRELDATERPERPLPSGRVTPAQALGVATGLTAAGIGLAALGGGTKALKIALPLAGAIWTYDLLAKDTPAGPAAMALCRGLDVMLGAGKAVPAAAVVAGHTWGVTALSRGEVHGSSRRKVTAALTGTAAVALAAAYVGTVAPGQAGARRSPTAAKVRAATKAGIHAMIPLQAALIGRRNLRAALLTAALLPLARKLSRRVSPT
nr:hypothetical protein [uncultured bacterium]